jgi:ATP:ADP antiporter, AAA family
LSVVADVRAGEGVQVFILALDVFVLLAGYYLLKTVRESLILTEGGAAVKTYSSAAQAVLLMLLIPAFGAIASRVSRVKLIGFVLSFFISNLIIFYLLGTAGFAAGVYFFIWVGVFNVMAIAQFWAFANDLYTERQGKRVFPAIGVGSSVGAWFGAVAADPLIKWLGPYPLMLIAAVALAICILLTILAHSRSIARHDRRALEEAPLGKTGGFHLLIEDRYLLLIAVLMIVLNVVNTSGEFMLSTLVVDRARHVTAGLHAGARLAEEKWIGGFYGDFFGWVNLVSFLLQTFAVYRIFRLVGVSGALFVLPSIAMCSYTLIAILPVLDIVRIFKIAENSVDYSVQNTAWQALFLPTSREAKYKAKQVTDAFCMRIGDVFAAGVVWIGVHFAWQLRTFATVNICLTVGWFVIVAAIAREYRRRTVIPPQALAPAA